MRGVAPGAPLVGVKVVDCAGNGSSATIIKGIDRMVAHAKGPSVLNLSVGGGASPALDAAVQAAHAAGVFVVIAAGDSATDACLLSPSMSGTVEGILTVGAVDVNEAEAPLSNFGGCIGFCGRLASASLRSGAALADYGRCPAPPWPRRTRPAPARRCTSPVIRRPPADVESGADGIERHSRNRQQGRTRRPAAG